MLGQTVLTKFTADTGDFDKGVKKVESSVGDIAKGNILATAATKAFGAAWNLVSQNMDKAIDRYDTLQNFPKVLSNFGVSADEASASVNRIADSILDLPTSLDQAVAGVQNLFMVTKDLKKSEAIFTAINDSAMVFANGSTDAVDRFIYAYKQSLSMGKVKAQEFNQMNEAIPGLMDKVAESMGISYAELKDGLSKGDIEIEKFNDTLKKLDTEGVGSMKALRKAAFDATGGIKTALTNMNSRIAAGLAEMIDAVNKGMQEAGVGSLADVFANTGTKIKEILKGLAPYILNVIILFKNMYDWLSNNKDLQEIIGIFNELKNSWKEIFEFVQPYFPIVESFVVDVIGNTIKLLKDILVWITKNRDLIIILTQVLIAFFAAWKVIQLMSFIQQVGGVLNALSMLKTALFGAEVAKIKDSLATARLTVMYAKDFVVGIVKGTAALIKNTACFIAQKTAMLAAAVATKVVAAAQWLLNAAMSASPITWIIIAIIALVAVFVILWKKCEGFRNFWIGLWEGLQPFVQGAIEGVKGMIMGLVNIIKTVWNTIKTIFDTVINFVKNNWQGLLLMIVNPWAGGFKLLYDNCEVFRNFVDGFVAKIKAFFSNLKTAIGNAISGIINFIKSIPGKIMSIPTQIFNFFKSLPSKMLSIGLDIVKGIGKGITNGFTWIKNRIKEFVGNVTDFIKKVFKIGSPSKLMENQVGQWIPKGIAVGIDANVDSVYKSMAGMQKELSHTFQLSPQVANSSALHYSPTVISNVEVNMQQDPLGQMVRDVKTFSGGSKNDYNYGMGV